MQVPVTAWLKGGNEDAYCGRDGWLFYRRDIDSLTGRGFLGDSFANIFSVASMGWGEGAGLAEHLSLALGLPVELLGILVAVEIVPDIFRTIGNVTADVAVTVLVDESEPTRA